MSIKLRDYQVKALNDMRNGCILNGGVGSGKSITSIAYYFKECGGDIAEDGLIIPMGHPKDLYIITTARKRDTYEWEGELAPFLLSTHEDCNYYKNKVVVDSWNNIKKYIDVKDAFFIFDEQRVVGYGAWTKTFLKITKNNRWILLSATPGDTWTDYIPVFIANGFYKNKTEFQREHIVYSRFSKYPKIDRYINTGRLIRLRNRILVDMDFTRHTVPHHEDVFVNYDIPMYKQVARTKTNPFYTAYIPCRPGDDRSLLVGVDILLDDVKPIMPGWSFAPKDGDYVKLVYRPIKTASELCYVWRRIVNSDESRQMAVLELIEKHPKAIIFYNFDYELEILKGLYYGEGFEVAEWNGHKHQPIPEGKRWVYLVQYNAGAEGWNCITTDTIIFYSQTYSWKQLEQARGRIDRLNTPYVDLYYYHIRSRSGIDLAITRALKNKKNFNERKFSDGKM